MDEAFMSKPSSSRSFKFRIVMVGASSSPRLAYATRILSLTLSNVVVSEDLQVDIYHLSKLKQFLPRNTLVVARMLECAD